VEDLVKVGLVQSIEPCRQAMEGGHSQWEPQFAGRGSKECPREQKREEQNHMKTSSTYSQKQKLQRKWELRLL
jgi:hypothetical protein